MKLRLIFLFGIIAVILLWTITCSQLRLNSKKQSDIANIPDTNYCVMTTSRIYYTDFCKDDGNTIIIKDYYEYNKTKWTQQKMTLTLDRTIFGEIEVKENAK